LETDSETSFNTAMLNLKLQKRIKIFYTWAFTDTKTTAAIDITNRCNLKCSHCYWWKEERPEELNDEEMIAFMKKLRRSGVQAVILYGGEPLMRPNICEAATRIFNFTHIFTNGTLGFLPLDVQWLLSLDGTREVHDRIRGEGVYDTVMENLSQPRRKPIVHITITQQNRHNIEAFLEEMSSKPIRGVGFSFHTPHKGKDESDIFIPLDERDQIVDELLRLRKKYWRIMGFTKAMAHQLKQGGEFSKWNNLKTCSVAEVVTCYNSDGTVKPCTYGKEADCSRCGCASVVAYRAAIKRFDPQSLFIVNSLVW